MHLFNVCDCCLWIGTIQIVRIVKQQIKLLIMVFKAFIKDTPVSQKSYHMCDLHEPELKLYTTTMHIQILKKDISW